MSFILNALRKSEQERLSSQEETLDAKILEKNDYKQHKTSVWLILLVIVNVFFISYFIWSSSKDDGNKEDDISVVSEKNIVPAKPEVKLKEKTEEQEKVLTLPVIEKEKVLQPTIIETEKKQLSIAEQLKRKQVINQPVVKETLDQKAIQLSEQKKQPVSKIEPVKEPELVIDPEKIKIEVQKETENEPPFLSTLDYDFRRTVPDIDINVFVYTENVEGRFIMINMK
ncbi:MAG: hypothetical protein KAI44_04460, partial [Methylococcales bacterium]|nr:hypothetical protein [Methylococcales bacterium]